VFINSKTDKEMIRKSKEQETDGKKRKVLQETVMVYERGIRGTQK